MKVQMIKIVKNGEPVSLGISQYDAVNSITKGSYVHITGITYEVIAILHDVKSNVTLLYVKEGKSLNNMIGSFSKSFDSIV